MTGNDPVDTLLLVASIVVAVGIIWSKAVKPGFQVVRRVWRALKRMADQWEKLDTIAEQFMANGGTSMIDRISRMEIRQNEIIRQLEQVLISDGRDVEWPT